MKVFVSRTVGLVTAVGLMIISSGCSMFSDGPKPTAKVPEIYRVASRRLPPEPVYNKVRSVHLPITYPEVSAPEKGHLELKKTLRIGVKNMPLEQIATSLAAASKYSAYTASTVATKKVTFNSYGDLDQVAADLALASGTNVAVDHENREIRVLEQQVNLDTEAKFASAK